MGFHPSDVGFDEYDDLRQICAGIWLAGEPEGPTHLADVIVPIAKALRIVGMWDQMDNRPFVKCETWNPANLARLLTRGPDREDLLIRRARQHSRLNRVLEAEPKTRKGVA